MNIVYFFEDNDQLLKQPAWIGIYSVMIMLHNYVSYDRWLQSCTCG